MSTLRDYFHAEIIGGKEKRFSWWKVLRRARRSKRCNYLFWFRIANQLHGSKNRTLKSLGNSIGDWLVRRYSIEIMLGAEIGEGLMIGHNVGIVITKQVRIGKNFMILQNTTIGTDNKSSDPIVIGDNVSVGANSCIIGSGMRIGDNVTIGAMSFVHRDIPDNHTFITEKTSRCWVTPNAEG
ncbi:serine acetyltransferase [Aestuariirhabdus litorea]|uniref:Serine acetyltransferase n=1 Tax=Aestuariirhabdus litorea TaxID=2528527 RepID=A0A3P3VJZ7_9GAMM|nr:DapH/DapD/GlmU-related protein [Aestuariirhabdus litorea]RRJ83051.1 serine acetyltransferase [Aestuariirhabdus litorea]RWW93209.1 serine acetyltransferase [Endozoicomonadaceae bacterium GTF-13]